MGIEPRPKLGKLLTAICTTPARFRYARFIHKRNARQYRLLVSHFANEI